MAVQLAQQFNNARKHGTYENGWRLGYVHHIEHRRGLTKCWWNKCDNYPHHSSTQHIQLEQLDAVRVVRTKKINKCDHMGPEYWRTSCTTHIRHPHHIMLVWHMVIVSSGIGTILNFECHNERTEQNENVKNDGCTLRRRFPVYCLYKIVYMCVCVCEWVCICANDVGPSAEGIRMGCATHHAHMYCVRCALASTDWQDFPFDRLKL